MYVITDEKWLVSEKTSICRIQNVKMGKSETSNSGGFLYPHCLLVEPFGRLRAVDLPLTLMRLAKR